MLAHACGIVGQEHAQCTLAYDGRVAMKQLRCRQALLIGLFATLWLLEGGLIATTHAARSTTALTADQATACIQAAVTAQAGMVTDVDVKETGGTRLCRVGIVDANGKKHKLQVDVTTNRVVQAK
jgi:hypothetical protein